MDFLGLLFLGLVGWFGGSTAAGLSSAASSIQSAKAQYKAYENEMIIIKKKATA